jgi:hypothetical protein
MGNWRWPTWLIVAWTVFMIVIMVAVIYPAVPEMEDYNPPAGEASQAGYQAGMAFGMALVYWGMGFIILGPLWFFTRPKVLCPVCGNKVSPNTVRCGRCGFMPGMGTPPPYGQAAYGQPPYGQPPAWPPAPPAPQGAWPPPAPGQPPAWPPAPPAPQGAWPPPAPGQPPAWPPAPGQPPAWPPAPGQPPAWPSAPSEPVQPPTDTKGQ